MTFTSVQQHALALMSAGGTAVAAAQAVGVHRNTIGNWLRLPEFREALARAADGQAQAWTRQVESLSAQAVDAIRLILADPLTPPATRLRAALAVRGVDTAVPKKAQPCTTPHHAPGRNHLCPCGSGKKYKRCCLSSQ